MPRPVVALGYEPDAPGGGGAAAIQEFAAVAVLPEAGDNCGIARVVIPRGARIRLRPGDPDAAAISLDHATLEGHRFAVKPIVPGEHLLSWGLTFGVCTRPIFPGNYCANERLIRSLRARNPPITDLPATPNFEDLIVPHVLDEQRFEPAQQVLEVSDGLTFLGYPRPGGRGVGTRNYVVLIGTTSVTAGYVKALEARIKASGAAAGFGNVDGVVAVAHTEGGGSRDGGDDAAAPWRPHNYALLLRALASFIAHPNVAAALVVDYRSPAETVWASEVQAFAQRSGTPIDSVPHAFVTLSGDLPADLATGAALVEQWLPLANACERSPQPLKHLSIAQQCGGSDAFSGVSGNPCAGHACMLLIARGGKAVLAETDELMGSESYILEKVKDVETARAFLSIVDRFKERLAWHGQSAESNPSGGNNYRGLYNIGLKSLGAAKKKHADVRLDGVLEYAQPCGPAAERGYYMMDSPGNDLESIAGQVGTGCNLIHFITGNGSITNFPFVPTIKIVTTSARFALLEKDMDFNAGRYQEGTPMPDLGCELLDLTLTVASGARSVGERAGHAQVSIWRNWNQSGPTDVSQWNHGPLAGRCVAMSPLATARATVATAVATAGSRAYPFAGFRVPRVRAAGGGAALSTAVEPQLTAVEQLGLILPTSLCSGEVARKIVGRLNGLIALAAAAPGSGGSGAAAAAAAPAPSEADVAAGTALAARVSRFECLPHTEGCGTGYPDGGIEMFSRLMLGHLTHPSVGPALCLEHGCEKTHNDFFNGALTTLGLDPAAYGYASIQLDGGIDSVTSKVVAYFLEQARAAPTASSTRAGGLDARGLSVALLLTEPPSAPVAPETALLAAALARTLVAHGGSLVLPSTSALLRARLFMDEVGQGGAAGDEVEGAGAAAAGGVPAVQPTLAFGQSLFLPARPSYACADSSSDAHPSPPPPPAAVQPGLHVMDMPAVRDASELVTGLAAGGVHLVLALTTEAAGGAPSGKPILAAGHPLVPVLHLGLMLPGGGGGSHALHAATDAVLAPPSGGSPIEDTVTEWLASTLQQLAAAAGGETLPVKAQAAAFFSVTRGHVGVST